MNRIINYPSMNPSSLLENQQLRFNRLAQGVLQRDFLGTLSVAGIYTQMLVVPSGLSVTVQPTSANVPGALYQPTQNDTIMPSGSATFLPVDTTQIVNQALLQTTSAALGPVTVPIVVGQSVYYIVEAQIQTADAAPQSLLFVSNTGGRSTATVNTVRQDSIAFQLKAGVPASTPVVPTVDSGWVLIATILVPYGTSTLTSGNVTMATAFPGFGASGAAPALESLSDVNVTSPTDGQALVYQTSSGKWINGAGGGGGGSGLFSGLITVPVLSAFTPVNVNGVGVVGSAVYTAVDSAAGIAARVNYVSTDDLGLLYQTQSGTYTVTALIATVVPQPGKVGLALYEPSTNKSNVFAQANANFGLYSYTDLQTFGAVVYQRTLWSNLQFMWLQIQNDGSQIHWRMSSDGVNFYEMLSTLISSLSITDVSHPAFLFEGYQVDGMATLMSWKVTP